MVEYLGVQMPWMAAGVWISALSLIGILIRQIGPWRKQASDAEAVIRSDLLARVRQLENGRERERARYEANQSLDRHMLGNVTQCFDALLLMLEMAPQKAAQAVAKIKEMRARQLVAETEEKAIIRAAQIAAFERTAAEIEEITQ